MCCAGLVPCLGYQPHQAPVPSPHQGVERAKDQGECLHSTHFMWGALQLLRACAARRQSRWRAANPRAGLSQAKIVHMCTYPRCEPKCARRRHRDKAVEGTNVRAIGAIHSRSFLTAFVSLAGLGLPSSTALSRTHSDSRSATARPGTPCVHTDRARRVVHGGPGHALPPQGVMHFSRRTSHARRRSRGCAFLHISRQHVRMSFSGYAPCGGCRTRPRSDTVGFRPPHMQIGEASCLFQRH